jgi:hypothetical protein
LLLSGCNVQTTLILTLALGGCAVLVRLMWVGGATSSKPKVLALCCNEKLRIEGCGATREQFDPRKELSVNPNRRYFPLKPLRGPSVVFYGSLGKLCAETGNEGLHLLINNNPRPVVEADIMVVLEGGEFNDSPTPPHRVPPTRTKRPHLQMQGNVSSRS